MKINIAIINGNQCLIDGPLKLLNKLYNEFTVKHPNAWQIRMHNKHWDGNVHFIGENCKFRIGLLPMITARLKELGHEVKIIDQRRLINIKPEIPKMIGNLKPRPEQKMVLEKILNNKIEGVPYYIGVQNLAVNFGKSMIMAGVYLAFKKQLRALLLTNDKDWLEQAKKEFPDLLPGEKITYVQGSKVKDWGMFSIGMVQSISRNVKTYQNELSKVDIVLIDECDIIDNKTYKTVIDHLWNTPIRLGLSGTVYLSKLKKDLLHNMNIRSFIGDELTTVSLDQMIKKGYSTPVVVKMIPTKVNEEKVKMSYDEEYQSVVLNKKNYKLSLQRTMMNFNLGRFPAIVVVKFIPHCENLYKYYRKKLDKSISIEFVHHDVKNRDDILKRFREGKIDILISTTIISRGKNFPLLQYLQNAGDLDSNEKVIQILGRLVRTHATKKKVFLDDLAYNGKYLSRHFRHRKNYYLKQNLKVLDLSKKHHKYGK